jgi:hypothetical protein
LYLHGPSGEYRVLYWTRVDQNQRAYYILTVRQGRSPRCIGVPSDAPGIDIVMLGWQTDLAPPVVFRNCLHWSEAGIVVFDTVVESFRFMRRPPGATRYCTTLCDMRGSIGFSCLDDAGTVAKIWVLEDYEKEIWSFKYHVDLPPNSLYKTRDREHLVLSHKGDVLVYDCHRGYMLHCDNTGKLLEEFVCDSWSMSLIGHRLKKNLAKHDFSLRRGCALVGQRFFQRV